LFLHNPPEDEKIDIVLVGKRFSSDLLSEVKKLNKIGNGIILMKYIPLTKESGGDLNMCIKMYISEKYPLAKLMENPYAFEIFNPEEDFEVELIESNIRNNYLIFKRKFDSSIGYVIVFCIHKITVEKLRELYEIYKKYCGRYSNYNFREFDFIIITNSIEKEALEIIKNYNEKYVHRRPITVIINKLEMMMKKK